MSNRVSKWGSLLNIRLYHSGPWRANHVLAHGTLWLTMRITTAQMDSTEAEQEVWGHCAPLLAVESWCCGGNHSSSTTKGAPLDSHSCLDHCSGRFTCPAGLCTAGWINFGKPFLSYRFLFSGQDYLIRRIAALETAVAISS